MGVLTRRRCDSAETPFMRERICATPCCDVAFMMPHWPVLSADFTPAVMRLALTQSMTASGLPCSTALLTCVPMLFSSCR